MKKVQKLVLGLLLVLLFAGVSTIDVWATDASAVGTDKKTAEEITHDTLYEKTYEVEFGKTFGEEYWYTFTTVDYVNYYDLYTTFDGSTASGMKYTLYDEDNTKLGYHDMNGYTKSLTMTVKLEPNTRYYLKTNYYDSSDGAKCDKITFKLIPHADVADVKDDAQVVEFNKLYEDSICVTGVDVDWYKIETGNYYRAYNVLLNSETGYSNCLVLCQDLVQVKMRFFPS